MMRQNWGDALTKIDEEDVQTLHKLTQKLHRCLKTVRVENVEGEKPDKMDRNVNLMPERKIKTSDQQD